MSAPARRLARLEERYGTPATDHPARIPDWLRPWFEGRTIADLELMEPALFPEAAAGDVAPLVPADRARRDALLDSFARFCEEHAP